MLPRPLLRRGGKTGASTTTGAVTITTTGGTTAEVGIKENTTTATEPVTKGRGSSARTFRAMAITLGSPDFRMILPTRPYCAARRPVASTLLELRKCAGAESVAQAQRRLTNPPARPTIVG